MTGDNYLDAEGAPLFPCNLLPYGPVRDETEEFLWRLAEAAPLLEWHLEAREVYTTQTRAIDAYELEIHGYIKYGIDKCLRGLDLNPIQAVIMNEKGRYNKYAHMGTYLEELRVSQETYLLILHASDMWQRVKNLNAFALTPLNEVRAHMHHILGLSMPPRLVYPLRGA